MHLRIRPPWEPHPLETTPESVFLGRRKFLASIGSAGLASLAPWATALAAPGDSAARVPPTERIPSAHLYPAKRNPRYTIDEEITAESFASRINIFDELSGSRDKVWEVARGIRYRPWTIHIGGQVEKSIAIDVDELIAKMPLEERLYRHRCVEAWAMAVPWTGFPFQALIDFARVQTKATHVRMVGMVRPDLAPAWNATRRVFPYYEALTLAEASHELAFLVTGVYGKPLPLQHGAPLRLAVPWKYGFKSIKSISAFEFTNTRPGTLWSELSPDNYKWESNVDPTETHPWSQAMETVLGTDVQRPTKPFNGYGDRVGGLYAKK